MATRIGARLPYRVFKDSGDVCTDATITFYLANTTTLQEVFSDKELTTTLGSTVSCNSVGVVPDIWVSDAISIKAIIAGTGVTSDTIDYLTVAASTVAGTTSGDLALVSGIVNGGLSCWTPGTSYSNISGSGTGVEVADDIYFVQSTAASNAISRQTANGTQSRYCMRVGRPNGSTSTNKLRIWGTIPTDECYRLRGQEVTFSFRVKAGATFSGTSLGVRIATGTTEAESGDLIEASGFAGNANPLNTTQAITTTATRYEFTCTLSASLKNLGWQIAYTGVGTAGATDYFEIEDIQLEIASAATAFQLTPEPLDFLRANLSSAQRSFIASPSSANLAAVLSDETGSGAAVFATSPTLVTPLLGTPTSGVLTNCTGLPVSSGISGLGTGVATWLATPSSANLVAAMTDEAGSGALYFTGGALGTPASGTLTNATGLPISTGVSGLGTGVATFLATPSSANLISAVTDETGSGALVFANTPTLVTPVLGVATATSINKVAITAPATSATLTIADGKTLTNSNTLTLTATDGATLAIGTGGTLGTAAYKATGTSGDTVPLLNGVNQWGDSPVIDGSSPGGTLVSYTETADTSTSGTMYLQQNYYAAAPAGASTGDFRAMYARMDATTAQTIAKLIAVSGYVYAAAAATLTNSFGATGQVICTAGATLTSSSGVLGTVRVEHASAVATTARGVQGVVSTNRASGVGVTDGAGVWGGAENQAAGTMTGCFGGDFEIRNTSTGAITTARGVRVTAYNISTGTGTNWYGWYSAFVNSGGGNITSWYHAYYAPRTGTAPTTNEYVIYAEDTAPSKFTGLVEAASFKGASSRMRALSGSIADDAATSFTINAGKSGFLLFSIGQSNTGTIAIWDSVGTYSIAGLVENETFVTIDYTTGALAGTTGTDVRITISIHTDDKIYIENRSGALISYRAFVFDE